MNFVHFVHSPLTYESSWIFDQQEEEVLWHATPEVKMQRLQRFTVAMDQQGSFESEKLWQLVSLAIKNDDQVGEWKCFDATLFLCN